MFSIEKSNTELQLNEPSPLIIKEKILLVVRIIT